MDNKLTENNSIFITVVALSIYIVSLLLMVSLNIVLRDAWFDPWDAWPIPEAGTPLAAWRNIFIGPVFILFFLFTVVGSLLITLAKIFRTQNRAFALWLSALAVASTLSLQILMLELSQTVPDLWSSIPNHSFQAITTYNHYIRVGPMALFCCIAIGIMYGLLWRINGDYLTPAHQKAARTAVFIVSLCLITGISAVPLMRTLSEEWFWTMYYTRSIYMPTAIVAASTITLFWLARQSRVL